MAGRLVSETLTKLSQMGDVTLHEPAGDSPQVERARLERANKSLTSAIASPTCKPRADPNPY